MEMMKKMERRLSRDNRVDTIPFLLGYRLFNSDGTKDTVTSQYFRSKSCERRRSMGFIDKYSPPLSKGKGSLRCWSYI